MTEDRQRSFDESGPPEPDDRPAPRNPFQKPDPHDEEGGPALIDSRRTAAIYGVAAGLIALVLVVGICVAASFAFG